VQNPKTYGGQLVRPERAVSLPAQGYIRGPISTNLKTSLKSIALRGRYLVRGGRNVGIEGDPPKGRIVISVFDSFEKAQAWRDSPEYKKILAVREREAKSRMYIVEGLPGV
jgi:uncharacterized protein (DUF1330 family)